jgi:hypothetical protein
MAVTHATYTQVRGRIEDWRAAIWSGVIAGAVFLMLEMVMVPLFLGESAWGPPRMIAAIVLGQGVLPPPATFDFGILMVAMMVHFMLSILYALIGGAIFERMPMGTAIIVGALLGLLLYAINFHGFAAVFEWFAMARNWVSIFAHAMFGLVAAWAYKGLARVPAEPH